MSSYNLIVVAVLALYLLANLGIGLYISKKQAQIDATEGKGFINNYFIGGRSMGGVVLAMTLVATFTSASSFVGGPGVAYSKGLIWVYLSMIQVPTAFIILGVLGKKFAVIARKTNAVTVTDYLKSRYKSDAVVIISSIALVVFFIATMIGQFIGGAKLLQTVTGLPYIYGLAAFGLIVILYTTVGGFKAVVTTDTIQGFTMVLGAFILLFTIVRVAGGFDNIVLKLNESNPVWSDPTSGGTTPKIYVMSFWILVGLGVLGLPQTAVRGMGFKDTKSLHDAMIYGTIVTGFLMLIMHISGVFAHAILDPSQVIDSDYVVPQVVMTYMNPVLAGLFIAAPLSAVMSTVSSLLILSSAAIVKDLYLNYVAKDVDNAQANMDKKLSSFSMIATLVIGLIVFILSINPPGLIVYINLFAFGGLECAFLCPILFGLYWKKANATGAILSMVLGTAVFIYFNIAKTSFGGLHVIVPSIAICIVLFVIGSYLGKPSDEETLELFFPS